LGVTGAGARSTAVWPIRDDVGATTETAAVAAHSAAACFDGGMVRPQNARVNNALALILPAAADGRR